MATGSRLFQRASMQVSPRMLFNFNSYYERGFLNFSRFFFFYFAYLFSEEKNIFYLIMNDPSPKGMLSHTHTHTHTHTLSLSLSLSLSLFVDTKVVFAFIISPFFLSSQGRCSGVAMLTALLEGSQQFLQSADDR